MSTITAYALITTSTTNNEQVSLTDLSTIYDDKEYL